MPRAAARAPSLAALLMADAPLASLGEERPRGWCWAELPVCRAEWGASSPLPGGISSPHTAGPYPGL